MGAEAMIPMRSPLKIKSIISKCIGRGKFISDAKERKKGEISKFT